MSRKQRGGESAYPETIRLEDCSFYHAMDIPAVGEVKGTRDLRGMFEDYVGHVELAGRTLLDVGTASGFLTFEAERRGATVTSFDTDSAANYQSLPSPYVKDRSIWVARRCRLRGCLSAFDSGSST
jgi:hypothetical protein